MIILRISHTSRRAGRGHDEWMRTMYTDKKDGTTVRTGRVYSAKECEEGRWYYTQYWVKMFEETRAV